MHANVAAVAEDDQVGARELGIAADGARRFGVALLVVQTAVRRVARQHVRRIALRRVAALSDTSRCVRECKHCLRSDLIKRLDLKVVEHGLEVVFVHHRLARRVLEFEHRVERVDEILVVLVEFIFDEIVERAT